MIIAITNVNATLESLLSVSQIDQLLLTKKVGQPYTFLFQNANATTKIYFEIAAPAVSGNSFVLIPNYGNTFQIDIEDLTELNIISDANVNLLLIACS